MFKKEFFHGIIAGVLASIAGIIYNHIYYFATEADFSKIINITSIISINILVCLIIAIVHFTFVKWLKKHIEILFNVTLSIVSFSLVMIPISISLPLDIKYPELFPGLAVPMVFFPLIAWYTINPLFKVGE